MGIRTAAMAAALLGMAAGGAQAQTSELAPSAPTGSGPYPALMETDPTLPTHTIYRPADTSKLGATRLPVVVWGNGACVNAGNRFRAFLTEVASYGYLVVAVGPIDSRPADAFPRPRIGANGERILPPPETTTSQLIDAIDWATAPTNRRREQLAANKIAVMGQSCGGVQAIEASADKRVSTTVIWNSGIPAAGTTMAGGKSLTKADLKSLHAPIAYIVGDLSDQAHPNAQDDFDRLEIPAFLGWERGVPHGGTYRQPNGGEFAGVAVAWLDWRLKSDRRAGRMFVGADCGLCVNPRWSVRRKNLR